MFKEYRGLRKELYVLFIGRMMTNMGSMIWPLLTLILSQKMHKSASEIATFMLAFSLCCMPMNLLGGKLADHFNKRNIIIVCDIFSIVAFIVCGLIELSDLTIILFGLASLFQSIEHPSYEALVADLTLPQDRNRAFSLAYLGSNLGMVMSPTIGGLLFKKHLSLAFFINAFAILLSTILIYLFVKDISRSVDENNIYEKEVDSQISVLKIIKSSRIIILFMIVRTLNDMMYSQYNYLMPLELGNFYGETGASIFGTMSSLNCLVVISFTVYITRKFMRVDDCNKLLIGAFLETGGYVIFALLLSHLFVDYASMFIFTLGEIFITITSTPYITKRIPSSHRGRIMAVTAVLNSLCTAFFTKVIGFIYDISGSMFAWLVVFVVCFFLILFTFILKKEDRKISE